MKLIIQIPCYNEEKTLPLTYNDLPKTIKGIDKVEVLISDDGSKDKTVEVAKQLGVDHIEKLPHNQGLAKNFKYALERSLKHGADIIVNTDGDNQYRGDDIPKLIQPILDGKADMVVGERPIKDIEDFSPLKKKLQKLGSWAVRLVSGTTIPEAPSGFRAYSREAAIRLNIVSNFSYTLETLIQAGRNDIKVTSVKIRTNRKTRESRLFKSIPHYIKNSLNTMLRLFVFYKPLQSFLILGGFFLFTGLILSSRVLFNVFVNDDTFKTYLPSTIIGGLSIVIGIIVSIQGLIADILHHNRRLNEEILYRLKKEKYDKKRSK